MQANFDFQAWTAARLLTVEQALERWVPAQAPAGLGDAMRYAVLDGGKRLRPLLVLAAREAVAQSVPDAALDEAALRAACAVELIHAYSLVHDDMPCMDNDVLRRGKPTVHVKFGEAAALLAGDALQALAFELLTPDDTSIPVAVQLRLCQRLARASGHAGMAGGQAIDLASVGVALNEAQLRQMHRLKTGALLEGSVLLGADCRGDLRRLPQHSRPAAGVRSDDQTGGAGLGGDSDDERILRLSFVGQVAPEPDPFYPVAGESRGQGWQSSSEYWADGER